MVESTRDTSVERGMVRQNTFTKDTMKLKGEYITTSERRIRRQWKSTSSAPSSPVESPLDCVAAVTDIKPSICVTSEKKQDWQQYGHQCGHQYGGVTNTLREQLAQQGDPGAQLHLAREILIQVAGGNLETQEEISHREELAMYWLLRAAQQGEQEARDTVMGLAVEGRGVTDTNYGDVAAVCKAGPRLTQGQFLGRTILRRLGEGRETVTSIQLARMAQHKDIVLTYTHTTPRIGREHLEESCYQFLEGNNPPLDQHLAVFSSLSIRDRILSKRVVFLFLLLLHLVPLWPHFTLPSNPQMLAYLLLSCSLSLNGVHRGLSRHQIWKNLLSKVSDNIDFQDTEARAGVRLILVPSVLFHVVLLQPFVSVDSSLSLSPCILSLGCLLSLSSLPVFTLRLMWVLLMFPLVSMSWDELLPVVSPLLLPTYVCPDMMQVTLLLLHLLPSFLCESSVQIQSELQLLVWWILTVMHTLGDNTHYAFLSIHVVASLGLCHLVCLTLIYRRGRLQLVSLLFVLIICHLQLCVSTPSSPTSIAWPEYHSACVATPSISSEATCVHLCGLQVSWSGQVTSVRLVDRSNLLEDVVRLLPAWVLLLAPLPCILGKPYNSCRPGTSLASGLVCRGRAHQGLKPWERCHLEQWTHYTYRVSVRMSAGPMFGHEQLLHLELTNIDRIELGRTVTFTGHLDNWVGGTVPRVTRVTNLDVRL